MLDGELWPSYGAAGGDEQATWDWGSWTVVLRSGDSSDGKDWRLMTSVNRYT